MYWFGWPRDTRLEGKPAAVGPLPPFWDADNYAMISAEIGGIDEPRFEQRSAWDMF
jgi:hypothetical protein